MSYEVFMMTYFMAPHKKSFMAMSGVEQRSMIEEILSLETLVERADTLKAIKKELDVDLKLVNRDIENASSTNEKAQNMLDDLSAKSDKFNRETEDEIKSIESGIEELKQIDFKTLEDTIDTIDKTKEKLEPVISNLDDLEKKRSQADSDLRSSQTSYRALESEYRSYCSVKENYDNFGEKTQGKIDELKYQLSGFEDESFYNDQVEKAVELVQVDNDINRLTRSIDEGSGKIDSLKSEIKSMEDGVCHYCGQSHYDKNKLEELNDLKEAHEAEMKETGIKLLEAEARSVELEHHLEHDMNPEQCLRDIEKIKSEISRLETELSTTNPYEDELKRFEGRDFDKMILESAQESIDIFSEVIQTVDYNIEKNRKQYSELNQEIDNLRENLVDHDINDRSDLNQLKGMESELLDEIKQLENKENPYDSQLKMAQDMFVDLDELKESRASIETDIKHVTYLVRLLTDSKSFIRKRIVDRFIPYLNKKIVQYTGQLGLPHICTINSDLSVDIEYMTKNVSYYNMSQGERMRLNIATTAALKDLLALLGTKIDTMFVDEVLDSSMDSGGMLKAFEFIKEHSKNLLLISHREELIGSVDNKMTIVKRNGFSIIE
jgi:DNA repair exonuclease SbcCD ATPase subunit